MKKAEKEFAIDLLKSLDIGMTGKVKPDAEYKIDMVGLTRKEILRTIKELMKRGYSKNESQEKQKD